MDITSWASQYVLGLWAAQPSPDRQLWCFARSLCVCRLSLLTTIKHSMATASSNIFCCVPPQTQHIHKHHALLLSHKKHTHTHSGCVCHSVAVTRNQFKITFDSAFAKLEQNTPPQSPRTRQWLAGCCCCTNIRIDSIT